MNFSACASWLCGRSTDKNEKAPSPGDMQGVALAAAPAPTAQAPASCDDVVPPPKNCYRLVMLGSARVGKTCLVSRFLGGKFQESYTPTIEDFHRKLYRIRGEIYQLDILDTSGNHPFPAMRRLSFLTGDIFVIVFSMDSRETFEEAVRLREQIIETKINAGGGSTAGGLARKKTQLRVPMVLVGNKCDREMKTVTTEEVQTFVAAQDPLCAFVEASAKKNLQVDEAFHRLFAVAGLPPEMAPNHHKRISAAFGAPCPLPPSSGSGGNQHAKRYHLSVKRRLSDACGVVAPNARRPSIRTDLMIMRTKTCGNGAGDGKGGGAANGAPAGGACALQ